jgi:hypothetical protein
MDDLVIVELVWFTSEDQSAHPMSENSGDQGNPLLGGSVVFVGVNPGRLDICAAPIIMEGKDEEDPALSLRHNAPDGLFPEDWQ